MPRLLKNRQFMIRNPRLFLLTGAVAVTLLASLAPLLESVWVYLLFQAVCHQQGERALWIAGGPMAVCARCFGIYAGAVLALLGKLPVRQRALAAASLLLAADVASEWLGLRPAWATGRLLVGLLAGATAAPLVARAVLEATRRPPSQLAHEAPGMDPGPPENTLGDIAEAGAD